MTFKGLGQLGQYLPTVEREKLRENAKNRSEYVFFSHENLEGSHADKPSHVAQPSQSSVPPLNSSTNTSTFAESAAEPQHDQNRPNSDQSPLKHRTPLRVHPLMNRHLSLPAGSCGTCRSNEK
jgi:hypothetical protein